MFGRRLASREAEGGRAERWGLEGACSSPIELARSGLYDEGATVRRPTNVSQSIGADVSRLSADRREGAGFYGPRA